MKGWQIALLVVGCSALAGTGVYLGVRKDLASEPRTEADATGKEEETSQGTWNAGDGTLFMLWKDGSWNDFKYRVGGAGAARRLRLVSGKRGEVWAPAE